MKSILIVAGENSGDKHGARLVQKYRDLRPSFEFYGIGGNHMSSEGVNLLFSIEELAIVGFFEVIAHLPRIRRILRTIKKEITEQPPYAAVLIDFPDFNLRLAKRIKKLSIPVLYYISPTVWAWRKNRLNIIKKTVNKMLLIFPFEEKIYTEYGIPATYVGHPLKESVKTTLTKEEFFAKYRLDPAKKTIAVLPGSRKSEIRFHVPILTQVIKNLSQELEVQFTLPLAENLAEDYVTSFLGDASTSVKILTKHAYEAIAYSDIALSSCGTANLEAALLGTPVVAFYRISPLTYFAGIRLMKITNFSIVNILAGRKIIPELIQRNFTTENIIEETRKILGSERLQSQMKKEYKQIHHILGNKIASENAARELEKLISYQESLQL
jgi:lipid-A-disaccharide synthase